MMLSSMNGRFMVLDGPHCGDACGDLPLVVLTSRGLGFIGHQASV